MAEAATDYDRQMAVARGKDVAAREAMAADRATAPEFLFFLADDPDIRVRRAVAANPSTPNKVDVTLSRDADISVRCAVARKIVGDGLDEARRRDMWRMGYTILETLMRDTVVRVRRILSDALNSDPEAPRNAVVGLARDREEAVAYPMLRKSPVLGDEDIIDIIGTGAPEWAQDAVAGRETVSPVIGELLVNQGSTRPIATVIANPGSVLSEQTLDGLVEKAETVTAWQEPLVNRPNMSGGLLIKLARFVAGSLLTALCGRGDIDAATADGINAALETRADEPRVRAVPSRVASSGGGPFGGASSRAGGSAAKQGRANPSRAARARAEKKAEPGSDGKARKRGGPTWGGQSDGKIQPVSRLRRGETPSARARRLFHANSLTDSAVALALDNWERDFVITALALRSGFRVDTVRRMVRSGSARTMVALSWKAGFGARFSMDLQRQLAGIPPPKLINARDGIDYPFTPADMEQQLSLFA